MSNSKPGVYIAKVDGYKNPVRCALAFLQSCDWAYEIDEESFDRMAEIVGDSPKEILEKGFRVETIKDLSKLCTAGNFVIAFLPDKDKAVCMTCEEWEESQSKFKE